MPTVNQLVVNIASGVHHIVMVFLDGQVCVVVLNMYGLNYYFAIPGVLKHYNEFCVGIFFRELIFVEDPDFQL